MGLGELIDRLCIVNLKLFKLKDRVVMCFDKIMLAQLAKQDVVLCEERAKLRNCIDAKMGRRGSELKSYGDS